MRTVKTTFFALAFALSANVLCTSTGHAKIPSPKLSELIKDSDYIVRGKVSRVLKISDTQIAEMEVADVLKGKHTTKKLYFMASPTWACDISHAEQNESCLYFLSRLKHTYVSETLGKRHPGFMQELESTLQGQPLHSIARSGYGRFIYNGLGKLEAPRWIEFPKSVAVKYIAKGEYSSAVLVEPKDIFWMIYVATRNGV